MGGPNLEVFKFGFYMFFPIYAMFKFGDPEWYETYVQPYKDMLYPPHEATNQAPRNPTELREAIDKLRDEMRQKAAARKAHSLEPASPSPSPSPAQTLPEASHDAATGAAASTGAVAQELERVGAGSGWVAGHGRGERLV